MANIKISELTALTPPAAADELPVVDVSATSTKKTTVGEVVGIINGDVEVANDGTATISELPVSKLQDGAARQLLQTDAAGTGVGWTSNVDVPGTLDVTSTATFDSIAQHPLGTAGAPTITFTGDTNTGIYSTGADQVAISTAGSGRLFVDASGRVGIGNSSPGSLLTARSTSSPTISIENNSSAGSGVVLFRSGGTNYGLQDRINIKGLITDSATGATALTVETSAGDLASPAERLRITSAGLVGIGTSSVGDLLHLRAGSSFAIQLDDTSNNHYIAAITSANNYGNGSAVGQLYLRGASGIGFTGNGGTSTGMVLDSSNRVGIGTTSPVRPLDLLSSANNNSIGLKNSDTGSGLFDGFAIQSSGLNAGLHNFEAGHIYFATSDAERARIDSSGRLLVGTGSDSGGALFQVNGNRIRVATAKTPASTADTGTAGEICWDADYIYVCTATNTWKRTAISTW